MNFIGRQWSRGKKNEKADKELNYKRDKSEKKKCKSAEHLIFK